MIKSMMKNLVGIIQIKRFCIQAGRKVYIGKHCNLKGKKNINLDNSVMIRPYTQIWAKGIVKIGQESEIGERCRISIAKSLNIGKKVLLSPNVYITDCDHEYRNVDIPIIDQGIVLEKNEVGIGDGTYVGINSVIVGNVKIGKHSIIGANSVVTKNVPDYCVAVGSPAKVIRVYNSEEKKWKRV